MLFSKLIRSVALGLVVLAPLTLSACSGLRPVYSDAAVAQKVALIYGEPGSHYEQVLYDDLALRLGKAQIGADAPKLSVSLRLRSAYLTSSKPVYRARRMTVTARIKLVAADGTTLFSGTRSESADYTNTPQVLATDQAADDAALRASHALADQIRLLVLGTLAK